MLHRDPFSLGPGGLFGCGLLRGRLFGGDPLGFRPGQSRPLRCGSFPSQPGRFGVESRGRPRRNRGRRSGLIGCRSAAGEQDDSCGRQRAEDHLGRSVAGSSSVPRRWRAVSPNRERGHEWNVRPVDRSRRSGCEPRHGRVTSMCPAVIHRSSRDRMARPLRPANEQMKQEGLIVHVIVELAADRGRAS